jgi:hypothetical protein
VPIFRARKATRNLSATNVRDRRLLNVMNFRCEFYTLESHALGGASLRWRSVGLRAPIGVHHFRVTRNRWTVCEFLRSLKFCDRPFPLSTSSQGVEGLQCSCDRNSGQVWPNGRESA